MKPRFVLRDGAWRQVSANPKPRFKTSVSGRLMLIRPALPPYQNDETSIKAIVVAHYGSVRAFSHRVGYSENAASWAFQSYGRPMAGKVRALRLALGLSSEPTYQACLQAFSKGTNPQTYRSAKQSGGAA